MALANKYFTHQGLDGKPGLSVEYVVISYHGGDNQARLGTAINGIMKTNLRYISNKDVIIQWIHRGADEAEYNEKIAPIMNRGSVTPAFPELTHNVTVSKEANG
ncbi:hypothetical protein [Methylomonas sp. AM2-LC]|uniref:hypothetical protein n=1 Tax=Methylomonas sp. AM2-LC TaxID=3153301 RepID=UPI003266528F